MGRWDDPPRRRAELVAAARGAVELDLVLAGVRYLNVFTGEVYDADVGVFDGRVAHVEPRPGRLSGREVLDRAGLWAVPGLIDTHVHVESSMLEPVEFARAVLPHGTTTVLIDPHELANVAGLDGVRYMLDASADSPLRTLVAAPSCVPSAPGVETAGASFDEAEISELLSWPRVVGLAEVMDYPGVLSGAGRMLRLLDAADAAGAFAQGHAPRLRGRDLSAYLAAGIDSDHETQEPDEALEKLRAGMVLEIRESSLSFNAAAAADALRGRGYLPNVTLCTDDVTAADLLARGHVDHVARRLVEEGLDPVDVIRFATLNAALRLRRHDLGALAPGRIADVALLSDLATVRVEEVYRNGVRVDESAFPTERAPAPEAVRDTVHLPPGLSADSFRLRVPAGARVRTIDYAPHGSPKTRFGETDDVHGAELLAVVDRHRTHGGVALAVLRGFGLGRGALATTVAHDCHQLAVVGRDPDDMLLACRTVAAAGGGLAYVAGGRVEAVVELPIAGLLSERPAEEVAAAVAALGEAVGVEHFMGIVVLTLAVSPEARLSDLGLVDVATQTLVPLLAGDRAATP
jgi:adenine deaminase